MVRPIPGRVLFVDDDPAMGGIVQKGLARHGFDVEVATSADLAFARIGGRRSGPAEALLACVIGEPRSARKRRYPRQVRAGMLETCPRPPLTPTANLLESASLPS